MDIITWTLASKLILLIYVSACQRFAKSRLCSVLAQEMLGRLGGPHGRQKTQFRLNFSHERLKGDLIPMSCILAYWQRKQAFSILQARPSVTHWNTQLIIFSLSPDPLKGTEFGYCRQLPRLDLRAAGQGGIYSFLCRRSSSLSAGDYGYMPRMQFFNMLGVAAALRVSWSAGWGLPGVWHCLTLFFVLRILYHAAHIFNNRKTHVRSTHLVACFQVCSAVPAYTLLIYWPFA